MRIAVLLALSVCALAAQNQTRPGRFHVQHPTLLSLGFQWAIEDDDNRNASVEVRFRKADTNEWQPGLPFLRIGGEQVYRTRESMTFTVPHGFAGSILNLQSATSYECEFTMKDPDGVAGQAVQRVTVSTRAEPKAYSGGRVLHVYPPDHHGPKLEPNFTGIKQAYYGIGTGDWTSVRMRKVQPGDTILVHAGMYRSERLNYVDPLSAPFTGSWSLSVKGTAEKPITIKGAGDGEAIFDGDGNHKIFDVMATHHHIFEGLTFRNTDVALFAGEKDVMGAVALTVRNCRFEDVGVGIWTESPESRDFFISDNLFLGREDQMRLIGWSYPGSLAGIYPAHRLRSFFAVKVYGPGHVIAHNAIAYFHDGICISTYGPPDPDPERQSSSIDIYNNDVHLSNDDFIEADGGSHNIRVFQNRGINAAHNGYSSQPIFGGPVYFFRNILYNVPSGGAFKMGAKPAGVLIYHNTLIGEQAARDPYSNAHWRNNLFLGRNAADRGIMTWANGTANYSSDYNGYRPNPGARSQFTWLAPAAGKTIYEPKDSDWQSFATLAELGKATGQEQHGIEVDYDIFENLTPPDASKRYHVYHSMDLNFNLKAGGKAVDAGQILPTINDGFTGKAPDLGALELGKPAPHYGPRWLTWTPFYR